MIIARFPAPTAFLNNSDLASGASDFDNNKVDIKFPFATNIFAYTYLPKCLHGGIFHCMSISRISTRLLLVLLTTTYAWAKTAARSCLIAVPISVPILPVQALESALSLAKLYTKPSDVINVEVYQEPDLIKLYGLRAMVRSHWHWWVKLKSLAWPLPRPVSNHRSLQSWLFGESSTR